MKTVIAAIGWSPLSFGLFLLVILILLLDSAIDELLVTKCYRDWWVYRRIMGKNAKAPLTGEEVSKMDENRTEREEENERRLHERIRQNAQRDFSQLGFPADPLKIVGNSARPESEAQQKPENGKREREKQNPENGAQK